MEPLASCKRSSCFVAFLIRTARTPVPFNNVDRSRQQDPFMWKLKKKPLERGKLFLTNAQERPSEVRKVPHQEETFLWWSG